MERGADYRLSDRAVNYMASSSCARDEVGLAKENSGAKLRILLRRYSYNCV